MTIIDACPGIENLLRKSHFDPFSCPFSLNMSNYSPQMTKKMDLKWLPLAKAPIPGQAPVFYENKPCKYQPGCGLYS
jgi:hypothetical protein